jgi:3-phenylpropionate/cinnamic acid dioxygenase small subunit
MKEHFMARKSEAAHHPVVTTNTDTYELLKAVEQFLYLEAKYMDLNEYDEWLSLWDTECLYWVPCNADDIDPHRAVSLIFDKRSQLEERLFRLKGRHAFAQQPRSRLQRVVSNVVVEGATFESVSASSSFVLGELRNNTETVWFGRCLYKLNRTFTGLQIREKKVLLLNNDAPLPNITFLI